MTETETDPPLDRRDPNRISSAAPTRRGTWKAARTAGQCSVVSEKLLELLNGPTGRLTIGRRTQYHQDPQLVLYRHLGFELPSNFRLEDDCLIHERAIAVLGAEQQYQQPHWASEFFPGVTLLEVLRAYRNRNENVPAHVAARIVCEALEICTDARATRNCLVSESSPVDLFADTVWLSGSGRVYLSELGLACHQPPSLAVNTAALSNNTIAAGRLLLECLGSLSSASKPADSESCQPKRLPKNDEMLTIAERAIGHKEPDFTTVNQMLQALRSAPLATDAEVARSVQTVCGAALVERQSFVFSRDCTGLEPLHDEETACFHYSNELTPRNSKIKREAEPPAEFSERGLSTDNLKEDAHRVIASKIPPAASGKLSPTSIYSARIVWIVLGLSVLAAVTAVTAVTAVCAKYGLFQK